MKYVTVLEADDHVEVVSGMCKHSERSETMTVEQALVVVNNHNIGKYHPDVYVTTTQEGLEVVAISSLNAKGAEIDQLATVV